MKIVGAEVFDEQGFTRRDICIAHGQFSEMSEDDVLIDGTGLYAIPGLIDIHFHGANGFDFCDATPMAYESIASYQLQHGITSICPATMTFPEEVLLSIMECAADFANGCSPCARLVGINMEGPFISEEKIGAQNPKFVKRADEKMFERLQEKSGGLIKLVDISPEFAENLSFISKMSKKVHISLAHTGATYDEALQAFEYGADHVTHLFNAMPGLNHRLPGPIAAAAEKGAYAEIIADGVHVHPAMVRLAFKLFGKDKIIFISDSMRACGLSDGLYDLGGQQVRVHGRRATLEKDADTIAGSVTNLFDCLRTAVLEMGIPLVDAVRAATINPAKSIGIDDMYGSLHTGKIGNVLLLNKNLELVNIIFEGKAI